MRPKQFYELLLCLLSPLYRVFTIIYPKQTVFLRYVVLQLFCIYSLSYTLCYFAREICFVPLHQHFPQSVCSAQYGCLQFLNFGLSLLLLLLLLPSSSSSSSSLSPLCWVFIHIFLRQTIPLGNTVFQLFCHYYLWCLYR